MYIETSPQRSGRLIRVASCQYRKLLELCAIKCLSQHFGPCLELEVG